jgi:hypothetical protein
VITFASVTLAAVKQLRAQELLERNHKDPTIVPTINFKNWAKTMESLDQWVRGHCGVDDSLLGYVTRKPENLFPPAAADDPPMGAADSTHMSHDDEVVARHRIVNQASATRTLKQHKNSGLFTEIYLSDRKRVWDLLSSLLGETDASAVIKPFKDKCNGRGAFLALWDHYLDPNNVDHMANKAEKSLATSRYHAKTRTFTFERLVLMHLKAHSILESLVEHGYNGIDERSKVCHLMEAIKTTKLDAAKAQIMANADLRTNFNACVTLFKDFIAQERSANGNERQISALNVTGGSSDPNDRYVPDPEWQAMSKDERDKVRAAQEASRKAKKAGGGGNGGGNGKKKGGANAHKKSKQSKSMKKEVKRQVAAALSKQSGDDEDEEKVPMKTDDGDGHKMRQAAKQKSGSN